jgi:hypothetical protein
MKALGIGLLLAMGSVVRADTSYSAIYFHGHKIGYSSVATYPDVLDGKPITRIESHWEMSTLAGPESKSTTDVKIWQTLGGRPLRNESVMSRPGHLTKTVSDYRDSEVETIVEMDGVKTHGITKIPADALFDDTGKVIAAHLKQPGQTFSYSGFDDESFRFNRVELKATGISTFDNNGKQVTGLVTESRIEGSANVFYTDSLGEVLREEFGGGLVLMPEPKEVALREPNTKLNLIDLVDEMSLKTDKPVENCLRLKRFYVEFIGGDLSSLPSDGYQTLKKDGDDWLVDIHPQMIDHVADESLKDAQSGQLQWTQPSPYMPSNDAQLMALAAKLTRRSKNVLQAGLSIMHFVSRTIKPEISAHAEQDAVTILECKKGKCTDYAILTTTLLRAAGIPSRIVSGFLASGNALFYHAWSEMWDGHEWLGIDAALGQDQLAACHVELASGNTEQAFQIPVPDPDKVKIRVLYTGY